LTAPGITINSTTVAQLATDIAALAAAARQAIENVIGIVGVDEAYISSTGQGGSIADATVVSYVNTIYTAVRAAVPASVPLRWHGDTLRCVRRLARFWLYSSPTKPALTTSLRPVISFRFIRSMR
jgi:hypothetical protein